jgi:5-formyltetrahydrofolate cyclo-ligase
VRAALAARLGAIGGDLRADLSALVCAHLAAAPFFTAATTVMLYAPLPSEVDVTLLARAALDAGKRLCYPRMVWAERRIIPAAVRDLDADFILLQRLALREPRADSPPAPTEDIDLIVVPGLGFDRSGGRLGRGAGFYDRFLADPRRRAVACGVAFSAMVVEHIPMDAHDVRMDAIATEDGIITVRPPDHPAGS